MKLCLLGIPRSGSTSLFFMVRDHIEKNGYVSIPDPFHSPFLEPFKIKYGLDLSTNNELLNIDNLFIKTLIGDEQYPTSQFKNYDEYLNWINSFFDKIVVLIRKDKRKQAESFAFNESSGQDWHVPKQYDLTKVEPSYIDRMEISFKQSEVTLLDFANKNNYPVIYYEDIFVEHNENVVKQFLSYFNIEIDRDIYKKWVSIGKKVRIDPPLVNKLF